MGIPHLFSVVLSFVNLWFEGHHGLPGASWIKGNHLLCHLDSPCSPAAGRRGNKATVGVWRCLGFSSTALERKSSHLSSYTDKGKPHVVTSWYSEFSSCLYPFIINLQINTCPYVLILLCCPIHLFSSCLSWSMFLLLSIFLQLHLVMKEKTTGREKCQIKRLSGLVSHNLAHSWPPPMQVVSPVLRAFSH